MIKEVEAMIFRGQVETTSVLLSARNRLPLRAKKARDLLQEVAYDRALRIVSQVTITTAIEKVEEKRRKLLSGK